MVLSPFDEQLESQAGGGGTSVLAQIREAERQRQIAEEAARFREAERQQAAEAARRAEAARQAELARQAEVARQLAAFREAQRQQELQREQQAEAARRAELARQAAIAAEQARFREEQRRAEQERARQAEAARRTEAARQAQLQVERDRLRAIERERELEQQRVEARQAEARALERARQDELDRQREQDRLRAKERELQLEREQEQIRQRERLEPEPTAAPARVPGLEEAGARLLEDTPARRAGAAATRDAFRAERELRDRNAALRRAFAAVPGGAENLATIEALVDASERSAGGLSDAEERLFAAGLAQDEAAAAAGPASVLPELAGRTPGEAEALIRERAGAIERGLEAHDLFLEERRRRSANDPVRRRLQDTPGGSALITTLELAGEAADGALNNSRTTLERSRFGGAEDDDALGAERTLSERNAARRRAFGVLEDGERTLAAVELLAANGDGRARNPRALSAADEERLFAAELAVQEAASVAGAPSVLREVQAMLAEEEAAEQETLIQEIAAKIPGGTESVADFRREQRAKEASAAHTAPFTLEEQQSEFVRLKKLPRNRNASDDDLWAQAAQNLSRPRTRGLEQLGGQTAMDEFEPGSAFVPVDRSIGVGDLFGGFRSPSGRDDLTVQIGSVEDEVDVGPFEGLPERDLPRERFFTLDEQQSEFVRLKKLPRNRDASDDDLWAQAAQNLSRPRTRGLEQLGGQTALDEFEPGSTFVPVDRSIGVGDLLGGFRSPSGRDDLTVQVGSVEDEVDVSPFAGLAERDLPRERFFTIEEQQSEFVRLKKLPRNRDANDDELWARAAQNLSRPRTRGLEQLGGQTALDEFEPGSAFVPVDRSIGVGDLLGGFRSPSGRDDLTVQLGSVEDEVDVSPFAGLPQRDSPRERFFTLEEQQSEFVRLKDLQSNDGVNDNVLWAQAGQNLAAPRTRGLEGLGGQVATDEFEPGTAFVPIDRKVRVGDLFGGFRPESRPDLDVQIGPSEAEIGAGAPSVLPIEEAILFRRLRPLHRGMDHDDLMVQVRRLVRAARTRGIDGMTLDAVIAEFDPSADRRFNEDNGFGAALREGLSEPAKWVANCLTGKLAEDAAVGYAATGRVTAPTPNGVAVHLAACAAEQVAGDLGISR